MRSGLPVRVWAWPILRILLVIVESTRVVHHQGLVALLERNIFEIDVIDCRMTLKFDPVSRLFVEALKY
jgi:hypothetical protein